MKGLCLQRQPEGRAKISQYRDGSLHQGGEVPRRQGTGGDAAWEDWGRLARDHLERGDHEQQAGDD